MAPMKGYISADQKQDMITSVIASPMAKFLMLDIMQNKSW